MKTEISDVIAEILRNSLPDLESRLGYQSEALNDNVCSNPIIGKWVDGHDVKYLLSALALKDDDFGEFFPAFRHIKLAERHQIADTIEAHFEECSHCSLKRGYDLELDQKIKNVCLEYRKVLLQRLDEDADVSEDDHLIVRVASQ